MDCLVQFQKLCQLDTRRLLLIMGLIFAVVLVFQSSTLPYGNVFLSLFPPRRIGLLGKSSSSSGNPIAESEMLDKSNVLNGSTPDASSSTFWILNRTKSYDTPKPNNHTNHGKNEDQNIGGNEVHKSSFNYIFHNKNFTRENVGSPDGSYSLEKGKEPSISMEQVIQSNSNVSLENVQNNGTKLIIETVGSMTVSVPSIPPTLAPVSSFSNFSLFNKSDEDSSAPIAFVNSNISSAGTSGTGIFHENPSSLQNASNASEGNRAMNDTSTISKGKEPQTPISRLNSLLRQSRDSVHSMRPLWSSIRDNELLSAKSQISRAPIIRNDPELYPSVFRNVSMFKRSYELMEQLLKVYIYSEGEKPIFHEPTEPILKGIYASEGWFMRQMEKNKQFVVSDPSKAHLFYLPISSRMLQLQLYVRNSHSRQNLADYMNNYADMIAAKYPFWNRTSGADHFLVACHDWAPFETRGRMDNCIKVLCNANIARDFKIGKDVTLPESQVRKIQDPLRDVGGNPPKERSILAFFAGGMHGSLRPILLKYWGNKEPDMKIFGSMPEGGMSYVQHLKNSKYCVCPRGYDVHSPRVVEAIFYECVPVIISDDFVPPLFEVLDWEAFAVFVPEKDVPDLRDILLSIPKEKYLEMHQRVKRVQRHLLWHIQPVKYDIFHMILHSVWLHRLNRL